MEPEKSTGSGASAAAAAGAGTAAPRKRSGRKGAKPTGAESKKPGPTPSEILMIFQSAVHLMARVTGTIDVANGTGDTLFLRLPRSMHICQEPGCLRLFLAPVPDSLYCDIHRAGHGNETIINVPLEAVYDKWNNPDSQGAAPGGDPGSIQSGQPDGGGSEGAPGGPADAGG